MENLVIHTPPQLSIIIVSFNTKELLKECLQAILKEVNDLSAEIIVVDNASRDESAEMTAQYFPDVILIKSQINLGFAAANNLAFKHSKGKYIVLLNSDAFIHAGCLKMALEKIESSPHVGMGGARLVGPDNSWQPSARRFPSLLYEFFQISGLSDKYTQSQVLGRFISTCDPQDLACETDWVPGAFAIMPRYVIEKTGLFDENFFLYYEEVDLCRRIKKAGYAIAYWPDIVVTHIGGSSAKTVTELDFSSKARQLTVWSLRSQFLYYRKHHGCIYTWVLYNFQKLWQYLRIVKNYQHEKKRQEAKRQIALLQQAWKDTQKGTYSPARPW